MDLYDKIYYNYCSICSGLKTRQYNYYLDNSLVPKDGQEKALNAIKQVMNCYQNHEKTSGLLLIGGVGAGKTFLSAGLVNTLVIQSKIYLNDYSSIISNYNQNTHYFDYLKSDFHWIEKNESICFVVLSELYEKLRRCYSNDDSYSSNMIMDHIKQSDLLILDDLGAEKTSDWTKEILFSIIDFRYNEELPLIVTTNCVPEELREKAGDRIFDRLREMCVLIPVTSKSQRITATL